MGRRRGGDKIHNKNKENIKQANYTQLIFETLKPLQNIAIKNAKKLLQSYGDKHNPERDNPSTRVHILVKILNIIPKIQDKLIDIKIR